MSFRAITLVTTCSLAVFFLAGCGDETGPYLYDGDPGPVHVHAIAVNGDETSVLAATHTGIFEARLDDTTAAKRIGKTFDVTALAGASDGVLLSSGHPDPKAQGTGALLGILRSTDGGISWRPVAWAGERYFTALKANGARAYGYDPATRDVVTSRNNGRRWRVAGRGPRALYDLTVARKNPRRLLATNFEGTWNSLDGGATWTRITRLTGLIADSRDGFVLTARKRTYVSADGRHWIDVAPSPAERPVASTSATDGSVYAVTHRGEQLYIWDGVSWRLERNLRE